VSGSADGARGGGDIGSEGGLTVEGGTIGATGLTADRVTQAKDLKLQNDGGSEREGGKPEKKTFDLRSRVFIRFFRYFCFSVSLPQLCP